MSRKELTQDVFLPQVGFPLPVGEEMLSAIKEERDYLNTVVVTELRRAGVPVKWMRILEVAAGRIVISGHPLTPRKISHWTFMTYKGRKVSIEEADFFQWYGKTEEGRKVRKVLEEKTPGSWGHFALQWAYVPGPVGVYIDPEAKLFRGGESNDWEPGKIYDWGPWKKDADNWANKITADTDSD